MSGETPVTVGMIISTLVANGVPPFKAFYSMSHTHYQVERDEDGRPYIEPTGVRWYVVNDKRPEQ